MTQDSKGSSKKKPKKTVSELELKSLLNRCVDSIDKCLPLLPNEAQKEAQEIIAETEQVLEGLEFYRTVLSVEEVFTTGLDILLKGWHDNQLILIPLSKIPEAFRPLLKKGAKFYVHINVEAKDINELVLKDFTPIV